MDAEQLQTYLEAGEGQTLEFKREHSNCAKDLVAFANSTGGILICGVDNSNNILGLGNLNDVKSQIRSCARNCEPPVPIKKIEKVKGIEENVLAVHIEEGTEAHKAPNGFYIRQGANSQKLKKDEIKDLMHSKGDISFGKSFINEFKYPEDFSENSLQFFLEKANITDNLESEELLINLGIAEEVGGSLRFTAAGVVLFGRNPKKFFTQAEVICNSYESKERISILDRDVIEGPLLLSINKIMDFILNNIDSKYVIEGLERREKPEVPFEALREAFINALMHRDYHRKEESTHIDIFPDKIEIRNPGGLVEGMRREDLGKKSMRRNPLIADILDRANLVERSGTGINRMKKAMSDNGLPEPEFDTNSHFEVTLKRSKDTEIPDVSKANLNERQKKALKKIYETGKITNSKYREMTDVSRRQALNDLNEMIDKDLIKKKGEGRGTFYTKE